MIVPASVCSIVATNVQPLTIGALPVSSMVVKDNTFVASS